MKKLKDNKLFCEILQYLLVIIVILECNSIYSQIYGCHLIIRLTITALACAILVFFILSKEIKIDKKIIFFIIYDILCSGLMLINTNNFSGFGVIILVFLIFLPLLLIYLSNLTKEELKSLFKKFVNVVIAISVVSVIFWLVILVFKLKPTNYIKIVWGKPYSIIPSYYNIYFNTQDVWWITGESLMRNTGIFTESPMYSAVLVVALIFNNLLNFENTKINFVKTIILFVTMISTISVTGIICSIIIIAANTKKYILAMKKIYRKIFIICLLIMIICMTPIGVEFLAKKLETSSAGHRNMDIKNGFKVFLEEPLLGHGINHERKTEKNYEIGYGYSNTIIPVITDGGIVLSAIYVISLISLIVEGVKCKKSNYLVLCSIFVILLFTTLIQYRLIMMFLISIIYCMGCNNNFLERNE